MKDVTLGDIALIAKCSKNTVSLALRGSSRISDARRQEIEKIALDLGYVPNLSARQLSAKRTGYIGIYTKALIDAVRTTLINDLITGFHGTGNHPILGLGDSPDQEWQESNWIQAFRAMRVEAIVLVAEITEAPGSITTGGVPTVLVHCQPDDRLQCDYIGLDRAEAAALGLDRLMSTGRRSIAVYGSEGSTFTEHCKNGTGAEVYTAKESEPSSQEYYAHFAANRKKYDAALFQDSEIAARFIARAMDDGVSIPDDLAVVAYDYYPHAQLLRVPLTTIEQPIHNLAERAIRMILNRVQNPNSPWVHEVLPHRLVPRLSG